MKTFGVFLCVGLPGPGAVGTFTAMRDFFCTTAGVRVPLLHGSATASRWLRLGDVVFGA